MYYSSGNYEAFSHPKKPEGVDGKSAYIIGSGLAALTVACYLVRDGQMKGEHIHIFERLNESAALNMELAKSGIPVKGISITSEELEAYFLNLTGGVSHA